MIFVVIALLILVAFLTWALIGTRFERDLAEKQAKSYLNDLQESERNYQALEIGRDEETEAHEMELASLMDAYHKLNQRNELVVNLMATQTEVIRDLQEITKYHDAHCLVNLDEVIELDDESPDEELEPTYWGVVRDLSNP